MSSRKPAKKKSLARAPSLGSSFTRCYGGGGPISPRVTNGLLDQMDVYYKKLGFEDEEEETPEEKEEELKGGVLNLGKSPPVQGKARGVAFAGFRRDSFSKARIGSKVKEACGQVLDAAKKSTPHLSELFVGNQLLMQVTSTSLVRQGSSVAPSAGFVDNSIVSSNSLPNSELFGA